ncbi:MAG: bifunctional phosphoserine phosphatase/homoserine phosphotransferase ThrH [Kiritimatiellae bacterium]|nr:bifunctional phosphoserine phosphatase/homoserine phosphotransferase ThrH [Kiritimatiellia bacterium]
MNLLCLDLEGVLVPEIWIAFSEATGIPGFRRTTRDEPDYDKLMRERIDRLAAHNLKLADIRAVIGNIEPLPGAKEFLDEARRIGEVVILSDTFTQFAGPLMEKLGRPALFCNDLAVADDGTVTGYRLRQSDGKRKAVEAFNSLNIRTMAAGDSFNDLGMIGTAGTGALFRTTSAIAAAHPEVPAYETYADLLAHFRRFASEA